MRAALINGQAAESRPPPENLIPTGEARPEPGWPALRYITLAIAAVQHEGSRDPVAARAFAGTGKYRLADDTDAICTPHC
jgi:hypothetical protein